jgi:hypothetical protein
MSDSSQTPPPPPSYTPAPTPEQPYSAQPYGAQAKTNVLAIISLVAAFVFPLAGIVTGHIAMSQIRKTGEQGQGLAKAGLILSYVFVALGIIAIILYVIFIVAIVSTSTTDYGTY